MGNAVAVPITQRADRPLAATSPRRGVDHGRRPPRDHLLAALAPLDDDARPGAAYLGDSTDILDCRDGPPLVQRGAAAAATTCVCRDVAAAGDPGTGGVPPV